MQNATPDFLFRGNAKKPVKLAVVPIYFSGYKHNDSQYEEQPDATNQKRIVFQLDDNVYERVECR